MESSRLGDTKEHHKTHSYRPQLNDKSFHPRRHPPFSKNGEVNQQDLSDRTIQHACLRSAYYRVSVKKEGIVRCPRLPATYTDFALPYGIACLQRKEDGTINKGRLSCVFVFVNSIVKYGCDFEAHDENLSRLLEPSTKCSLAFNGHKSKMFA